MTENLIWFGGLNYLKEVIVDRATSIPIIELTENLKLADEQAQKTDEKEKTEASKYLGDASIALNRAEALGHIDGKAAKDFKNQIADLEKKIKGKEATASFFTNLRSKLATFFEKQSETQDKGTLTSQREKNKLAKP